MVSRLPGRASGEVRLVSLNTALDGARRTGVSLQSHKAVGHFHQALE
jgi:hypothetical protein